MTAASAEAARRRKMEDEWAGFCKICVRVVVRAESMEAASHAFALHMQAEHKGMSA